MMRELLARGGVSVPPPSVLRTRRCTGVPHRSIVIRLESVYLPTYLL